MGAFEYTAVDATGRERKGVLEGDTARQVRQLLRDQNLFPVSLNEVAQQEKKQQRSASLVTVRRGVSAADLSLLTRQLATLVHSGLPLDEALQAVAEQTEKPRIKSVVLGVRAKVLEGHTLADGLSDFPRVFPEIYRATVAAANNPDISIRSSSASRTTRRVASSFAAARSTRCSTRFCCSSSAAASCRCC
jgi:general secretion pathway protein F